MVVMLVVDVHILYWYYFKTTVQNMCKYENNSCRKDSFWELVGVFGVSLMCVCLLNFVMVMLSIQLFLLFVILLFPPAFHASAILYVVLPHFLSHPLSPSLRASLNPD